MPNYQRGEKKPNSKSLNGVSIAGYLGDVRGGVKRQLHHSISQCQRGEKVSGLTRQEQAQERSVQKEQDCYSYIVFKLCLKILFKRNLNVFFFYKEIIL